ncbi:hypothetical protein [Streptomyces syringium]|uniref:Uncharacterized protein n=1 Tax=Streptomyces syringium TaxID=76729 RepID=A0ABS4YAR2_9ACTN|nr:hypothetical protein [Streptomyces syringium]MBP2405013.1 hypothetical protein [Streptomyces syringium]
MISFMSFNKMTDRSVVATCPLGGSLRGTGLPFGGAELIVIEERPSKASAMKAAGTAQAQAYAPVATINGAGSLNAQQYQHHTMWAFRGLEPWRDPA